MNRQLRHIFLLLATVLACSYGHAQTFTLKGRVLDSDGNSLELATVSCLSQSAVVMTNLKGEFQMQLASADSVTVRFSMVGYKGRERTFRNPKGTLTVSITLQPATDLQEVVVTERRRQVDTMEQIDLKEIKAAPSVTGNAIEELIQQQAGVSTHNELSSQYNVRGGSFDENSVYINNVEIYRPLLIRSGQQEGLSIINADMVDKVSFSSGGFSARYADKMSSALDITYRRPTRLETTATASLLGASAYLGMASKPEKESGRQRFTMSHGLRYKTNKYLLGSLETTGEYRPDFLDYQTFITYDPNSRWSMSLLGNISSNHYEFLPKDRETSFGTMEDVKSFKVYFDGKESDIFRTLFGTLSLKRHFGDSTYVELLGSSFSTREQESYDIQGQYWLDDTQSSRNLGVGTYMEHARNRLTANVHSLKLLGHKRIARHEAEAAITFKWEEIEERAREYEMRDSSGYSIPHRADRLDLIYTLASTNRLCARRVEGYLQDTYKWTTEGESFFSLTYGARFSHWSFNKETTVSPRASIAFVPGWNTDLTMRLSTGLYYQAPFYKELRDTTTQGAVTIATLNSHIKSPRSLQLLAALDYRFRMNERRFRFTAEAYCKSMANLIPYNVQNVKVTYYGQNMASGYAVGLDLKLYGEYVPGADSWLSMSLMRTRQKINGLWVPMPTDQRYAVNLHFTDYFPGSTRWRMTLKLAYADGLPFGAPHRGIEHQTFRAPAYRRADIGMSYLAYDSHTVTQRYGMRKIWLGIDCLNLFGMMNVNSYYWVTDVANRQWAVPNYLTGRQINGKITVEL